MIPNLLSIYIYSNEFLRARGDLPLPEPASPGHQPSEEHIDGLTAKVRSNDENATVMNRDAVHFSFKRFVTTAFLSISLMVNHDF